MYEVNSNSPLDKKEAAKVTLKSKFGVNDKSCKTCKHENNCIWYLARATHVIDPKKPRVKSNMVCEEWE